MSVVHGKLLCFVNNYIRKYFKWASFTHFPHAWTPKWFQFLIRIDSWGHSSQENYMENPSSFTFGLHYGPSNRLSNLFNEFEWRQLIKMCHLFWSWAIHTFSVTNNDFEWIWEKPRFREAAAKSYVFYVK